MNRLNLYGMLLVSVACLSMCIYTVTPSSDVLSALVISHGADRNPEGVKPTTLVMLPDGTLLQSHGTFGDEGSSILVRRLGAYRFVPLD